MGRTIASLGTAPSGEEAGSQKREIQEFAKQHRIKIDEYFELKVSGRRGYKQQQIKFLLDSLQPGDRLIVAELGCLGRSLGEVINILDTVFKAGVGVVAVRDDIKFGTGSDLGHKAVAHAINKFSELDRILSSTHIKAGIKEARAKGKSHGRPKGSLGKSKLDLHRAKIEKYLARGVSKTVICEIYDVDRSNFYHWLETRGI